MQRDDNRHVWLPLCIAVPVFALYSGSRSSIIWRRLEPPVVAGSKRTVKDTLIVPLESSAILGTFTYWLVRLRQEDAESKTDEAYGVIQRAHLSMVQAANQDRTAALVSVFNGGGMAGRPTGASYGSTVHPSTESLTYSTCPRIPTDTNTPEGPPFNLVERICMSIAKLWVCPTSVAAMRAALEGDLHAHGVSQRDIDLTAL